MWIYIVMHYIPFKRDLGDLKEKLQWAKDNDEKAQQISRNGRQFVMDHLLPKNIFCYHVKLFQEFSKKLVYKPKPADDTWELVEQPHDHESQCECHWKNIKMKVKDEL
ncbi:hypothetical protein CHS0354_038549 [Potamilus streckersoni]|uniref:Glycosyl transferase CAP10 domain-containing protein n=1 Tax=Potamilus streckersoni TaxID=2493646 RepID=A0AAE0VIY6_9BIVA|nr:hypothetical protein CHS0354_038549 [Potamilus streckersoni]